MEESMRGTLICAALAMMCGLSPAAGQPNAPGPAGSATDTTPGAAIDPSHFVSSITSHQWRASKLVGLDVYGSEDEKIGDVLDVLIGGEGKDVVVIGVGGFLGIARREIGVPFKSVDWRYGDPPRPRTSQTAAPPPATTGDVRARRTVDSSRRGYPDFAYVRVSREALQKAPEFKYEAP
jgi:hypothetical protein